VRQLRREIDQCLGHKYLEPEEFLLGYAAAPSAPVKWVGVSALTQRAMHLPGHSTGPIGDVDPPIAEGERAEQSVEVVPIHVPESSELAMVQNSVQLDQQAEK
jgi:hypothetical protein